MAGNQGDGTEPTFIMKTASVSLYSTYNVDAILRQIAPLWDAERLNLIVDLEWYDFARPFQLLVVGCFVKIMKACGRHVAVELRRPYKCDVDQYVSRMNFYSMIDIKVQEWFDRHDSSGRFVEITSTEPKYNDAVTKVSKVIEANFDVPRVILAGLRYSLSEIVSNVHTHAQSPIAGWVAAQNYPNRVEVCIADGGRGIADSLRTNPEYANLSDASALLQSLKRNVTRSKDRSEGMGMGLYHTSQILLRSGGRMQIYSGAHAINIENGKVNLVETPYWNGTIVCMEFRKNADFDVNELYEVFDGDPGVMITDAVEESILW